MKKTVMTLLGAVALAFSAAAEDYIVTVQLKDGKSVDFSFADKPVARFADGEMTVTQQTTDEKTTFVIADVEKMTVSKGNGVISAALDANPATFSIQGGKLRGAGLQPGLTVRVFTSGGSLAATSTASGEGSVEIETGNLAGGVYLVSAGEASFKFIKR